MECTDVHGKERAMLCRYYIIKVVIMPTGENCAFPLKLKSAIFTRDGYTGNPKVVSYIIDIIGNNDVIAKRLVSLAPAPRAGVPLTLCP